MPPSGGNAQRILRQRQPPQYVVEDSNFDLSYQGTVTVGGTQIPKVLVSYMYTPEGKLKEIYIVSSAPSHAAWRKAAFAGMGTALVESVKETG